MEGQESWNATVDGVSTWIAEFFDFYGFDETSKVAVHTIAMIRDVDGGMTTPVTDFHIGAARTVSNRTAMSSVYRFKRR